MRKGREGPQVRKFDVEQFLYDYSVSYTTSGKNVSQGWIGVQCPFCDDHSSHGGFNINEGYYNV